MTVLGLRMASGPPVLLPAVTEAEHRLAKLYNRLQMAEISALALQQKPKSATMDYAQVGAIVT